MAKPDLLARYGAARSEADFWRRRKRNFRQGDPASLQEIQNELKRAIADEKAALLACEEDDNQTYGFEAAQIMRDRDLTWKQRRAKVKK